jgi:hypothetical protein
MTAAGAPAEERPQAIMAVSCPPRLGCPCMPGLAAKTAQVIVHSRILDGAGMCRRLSISARLSGPGSLTAQKMLTGRAFAASAHAVSRPELSGGVSGKDTLGMRLR